MRITIPVDDIRSASARVAEAADGLAGATVSIPLDEGTYASSVLAAAAARFTAHTDNVQSALVTMWRRQGQGLSATAIEAADLERRHTSAITAFESRLP